MKRGVRFEISDDKLSHRVLSEILKPVPCRLYNWTFGHTEIYLYDQDFNMFDKSIFPEEDVVEGSVFERAINDHNYYTIFASLFGFPKSENIYEVWNYVDFVNSPCEIVVLVVDSSYVDIYCKDLNLIESLYAFVQQQGYDDIEYIDENDSRTGFDI